MEIKTKFEINEIVFFLHDGKLNSGKIRTVSCVKHPNTAGQEITYCISGKSWAYYEVVECLIYRSKDEAYESIFKNLEKDFE